MGKKLVIVESPAKARTINKILGRGYVVKASMGHVRDLPERRLGVDIANGFQPTYVLIQGKKRVVRELRAAAKGAEAVYLAPDPDREGEAIAWHLTHLLERDVPPERFFRVTYNEVTAPAIRKAIENPHRLDMRKVDSQQARRILDRLVGYMVSPLLWRRIRGGSSAGRVQSVALRLVCEREREIEAFVPRKYWIVGARVRKRVEPRDPFEARLIRVDGAKPDLGQEAQAEAVVREIQGRPFQVVDVGQREVARRPRPPFITSTLQQAASSAYGFSPARTMQIAQRLYEGVDFGEGPVGLITYMRTDSVSVAREAQEACRAFVRERFGPEYLPEHPPVYRSRSTAQEAHEAIRPTDVTRVPEELESHLKPDEWKLYRLIWQRFVASQMAPARLAIRHADLQAAPEKPGEGHVYLFRATASEILFPGYLRVAGEERRPQEEEEGGRQAEELGTPLAALPPLEKGEMLECLECFKVEKETQPPPRYTEATLVRALEENGVGRPSTYAQIISTLYERRYVVRDKRALRPTALGRAVNDFLVQHLGELFDVKFTAGMEASLDEIEEGRVEWTRMLADFYAKFTDWLERAKGPPARREDAEELLAALGHVTEWRATVGRNGETVSSDERFVRSVQEQFRAGRSLSQRQLEALARIAWRYRDQIPGWAELAARKGWEKPGEDRAEPPAEVREKLELLGTVRWAASGRKRRGTFDEARFVRSLREQVEAGRALSARQVQQLDRLLLKYADQLGGVEELTRRFGLKPTAVAGQEESRALLERLGHVKVWRAPATRRNRRWDDRAFYESLRRQFAERGGLTPRQLASLRKLVRRYEDQLPPAKEPASGRVVQPREEGNPA